MCWHNMSVCVVFTTLILYKMVNLALCCCGLHWDSQFHVIFTVFNPKKQIIIDVISKNQS